MVSCGLDKRIFFEDNLEVMSQNILKWILLRAIDFETNEFKGDPNGFGCHQGIMSGGNPGIGADYTVIESITIASKGNSVRFGEKDGLGMMSGSANATRGIFAGGSTVPTLGGFSNIDFVTIASEGNAVNFGDLTLSTYRSCAMASQTRAVFAHGTFTPGANARTSMDYITIASPRVSISIYSMTLLPGFPPKNIPLVELESPPRDQSDPVEFPKSIALP